MGNFLSNIGSAITGGLSALGSGIGSAASAIGNFFTGGGSQTPPAPSTQTASVSDSFHGGGLPESVVPTKTDVRTGLPESNLGYTNVPGTGAIPVSSVQKASYVPQSGYSNVPGVGGVPSRYLPSSSYVPKPVTSSNLFPNVRTASTGSGFGSSSPTTPSAPGMPAAGFVPSTYASPGVSGQSGTGGSTNPISSGGPGNSVVSASGRSGATGFQIQNNNPSGASSAAGAATGAMTLNPNDTENQKGIRKMVQYQGFNPPSGFVQTTTPQGGTAYQDSSTGALYLPQANQDGSQSLMLAPNTLPGSNIQAQNSGAVSATPFAGEVGVQPWSVGANPPAAGTLSPTGITIPGEGNGMVGGHIFSTSTGDYYLQVPGDPLNGGNTSYYKAGSVPDQYNNAFMQALQQNNLIGSGAPSPANPTGTALGPQVNAATPNTTGPGGTNMAGAGAVSLSNPGAPSPFFNDNFSAGSPGSPIDPTQLAALQSEIEELMKNGKLSANQRTALNTSLASMGTAMSGYLGSTNVTPNTMGLPPAQNDPAQEAFLASLPASQRSIYQSRVDQFKAIQGYNYTDNNGQTFSGVPALEANKIDLLKSLNAANLQGAQFYHETMNDPNLPEGVATSRLKAFNDQNDLRTKNLQGQLRQIQDAIDQSNSSVNSMLGISQFQQGFNFRQQSAGMNYALSLVNDGTLATMNPNDLQNLSGQYNVPLQNLEDLQRVALLKPDSMYQMTNGDLSTSVYATFRNKDGSFRQQLVTTLPGIQGLGAGNVFDYQGNASLFGAPGTAAGAGQNQAAANIAGILGISPTAPISGINPSALATAIMQNEGATSGPALQNNNPGNLKFMGQPGATQGSAATDGGYYAKFSSPAAGYQALQNDIQAKMKSGQYQTLNDFMNAYSPNSGAPSTSPTSTPSLGSQNFFWGANPSQSQGYVDLTQYPSGDQAIALARAKQANLPVITNPSDASTMQSIVTDKNNLLKAYDAMFKYFPKDSAGRLLAIPSQALQKYFQTDAGLSALNAYKEVAISSLIDISNVPGGRFTSKVNDITGGTNNYPKSADTLPTATALVKTLMGMIDDTAAGILHVNPKS